MITLGIIGVVAAMTMPALVQHYKKQETVSRVKKFYSMMSQVIQQSEVDNGPSINWEKTYYKDITDDDGEVSVEGNRKFALAYFNKYIKPYIKYTKIDENPKDLMTEDSPEQAAAVRVYLADGSSFTVDNGACIGLGVDVNGDNPPNESGKDIFGFVLCPKDKAARECGGNKNWCPYCPTAYCDTRAKALNMCKTKGTCARLLMMDGWEFKEDYPYKL